MDKKPRGIKYNALRIIPGAVIALFLGGCAASECLDNQNARPVAVFLASGGSSAGKPISVPSLTIYGIGAPGDSILADDQSLAGLTLPFRISEDETRYVFSYGGDLEGMRDTVTFRYKSVPEFVSEACGAIYAFDDLEVASTEWLIDSVVCPLKKITNVEREYIKIYFRTADEE